MGKISLKEFSQAIKEPWQPYEVAFIHGIALRLAKIQGAYKWHTHENEDEFFLVIDGSITIDTEEESVTLNEDEGYIVKRGVKHRSRADKLATILLIEPIATKTRGE